MSRKNPETKMYPATIRALREEIRSHDPTRRIEAKEATPVPSRDDIIVAATDSLVSRSGNEARTRIFGHILWMLAEVEKMPREKSAKAGRWMGWIFAVLEVLDVITNDDSRRLAKADSDDGNV